jgi:hypothetical protein
MIGTANYCSRCGGILATSLSAVAIAFKTAETDGEKSRTHDPGLPAYVGVLTIAGPCILLVPLFVFKRADHPFVRRGSPILVCML